MKQTQKSSNKIMVIQLLIGFVMAVLVCISILGVWAYFTASSERESNSNFASLSVNILQNGSALTNNKFTFSKTLIPGGSVELENISAKNNGNADIYVLAKLDIVITPAANNSSATTVNDTVWYNLAGVQVNTTNIQTGASLVETGSAFAINQIKYSISTALGNEYKNADVKVTLSLYGVQSLLPNDSTYTTAPVYASYLIISAIANN